MEIQKMHRINKGYSRLGFKVLLVIGISILTSCGQNAKEQPLTTAGKIDFSNWDFEQDGIALLNGEWEVYPEMFIHRVEDIPDINKQQLDLSPKFWAAETKEGKRVGYATMHLKLTLPDTIQKYSLKVYNVYSCYELWANNELLTKVGKISTTKDGAEPNAIPRIVELPQNQVIDLFFNISSWEHRRGGGILGPVSIGTAHQIYRHQQRGFMFEFAYWVISVSIAFYLIALYVFQKQYKLHLYVGAYAFFIALRAICEDGMVIKVMIESFPNDWHQRLRYIAGFLSVGLLYAYVFELYREKKPKILKIGLYGCLLFVGMAIILPLYEMSYLSPVFQVVSMPISIIALIYGLKPPHFTKEIQIVHAIGLFVLFAVMLHTVLVYSGFLANNGYYYNSGNLLFLLIQLWVMAMTRKQMNEEMESLTGQLKVLNHDLEQKVQVRTSKIEEKKIELEQQHFQIDEQTKKLLAMNEQLKELDQAKTRFIGNVSHELRTQITLILGSIQHLQSNGSAHDNQHELAIVERYSLLLHQLVDQLLDVIKVDADKMTLNKQKEAVITFFKEFFFAFQPIAEQKNIELDFSCNIEEYTGYLDRLAFEKVLYNLLSNAYKFTPENGLISLDIHFRGEQASITVKDTGRGIDSAILPRIFDRFYQANLMNEQQSEGVGIGLTLVKALVTLHDGQINVTSEKGVGTAFVIELPIKRALEAQEHSNQKRTTKMFDTFSPHLLEAVSSPVLKEKWKKTTDRPIVLIVEDSIDIHGLLKDELKKNYELIHAYNGEEGVVLAMEHMPDLVISDVMMPKKSGFELCQMLKGDDRTSHIPVMLLTARAEHDDKLKGLTAGADEYIAKPFNLEELRIKTRNLIYTQKELQKAFVQNTNVVLIDPVEAFENEEDQIFVKKLLDVLEEIHGNSQCDGRLVGEMLGMTMRHLNRKLSMIMGTSIGKMIVNFRLQKAKELLKSSDLQVGEIGFKVGFSSRAYFNKSFKENIGESPSSYRKKIISHP